MPDQPTVPFALPKYHSVEAAFRYVALLGVLLAAVWLGSWATGVLSRHEDATFSAPSKRRVARALRLARLATVLSVVGEVVYAREIIANPQLLLTAAAQGDFILAANVAQAGTIAGLTSLANLFVVGTAIFAILLFNAHTELPTKRTARRWLMLIGMIVTAHALLLGARMFVLYFLSIIAAAYVLNAGKRVRSSIICWTIAASVLLIWVGATMRDAGLYAARENVSVLSARAQGYARDVLVQHYLAADFNNAMVLLDCRPSMTYVGSTMLAGLSSLGNETYLNCPLIAETHGTINVLAQWWQDLGWVSLTIAGIVGVWLGSAFKRARHESDHLGIGTLGFLISFPGIFSMLRVNYFFQSIFVFPFLFLMCVWFIRWGLRSGRVPLAAR
jgi:hypothetical protein